MLYLTYKIMWVICMIKKQETMILSEYAGIYDLVVPKDLMTLYQDSLTQLNSSMPIEYLAAIHKSITNFSDTHDIGNGMGYEKYFVCKEQEKKPEYSLEDAVKQVISDYDKTRFGVNHISVESYFR